jgi:hypothetical protein
MDVLLVAYGRIAMPALVSLANHYLTTLSLWVGHWFSHLDGSPLRVFHLSGHHAFYPHSRAMRSQAFQYGSGTASSIYALLPWLLLQVLAEYTVLPLWMSVMCLLETALIVASLNYLHTQFHLCGPRLEQSRWFLDARARHEYHHDQDINFMVGDHFRDRCFRTYQSGLDARTEQMPTTTTGPAESRVL